MRKIRIHFYCSGEYDKPISRAIAGITGLWPPNWGTGPYSHVELEFCDRCGQCRELWNFVSSTSCSGKHQSKGLCFSAATRGGKTGVRFAPSSEILKHPDRWDCKELTIPDDQEQWLFEECQKLIGAKYDYIGCFAKITPWTSWLQMGERWYCSEVILNVLWKTGLLPKKMRYSPRAMSLLFRPLRNLATGKLI